MHQSSTPLVMKIHVLCDLYISFINHPSETVYSQRQNIPSAEAFISRISSTFVLTSLPPRPETFSAALKDCSYYSMQTLTNQSKAGASFTLRL